jgi:hypothetical protein
MATTSLIDQLTEVAADLIKDARKEAKPILKEGKRLAAGQAKAHAKLAKAQAKAQKESQDEAKSPKKKRHPLRKLLTLLAVGAAGAFVAKKLTADEQDWHSAE